MLITSEFVNKRLTATNIKEYLQANYGFGNEIHEVKRKQLSVPVFLQNNYGKSGDCTLTSILTLTKFFNKTLDTNEIYNYVEDLATKYFGYRGDSYGTIPFTHRVLLNQTFKHFGINRHFKVKYFKGIGYNLETIIQLLDAGIPLMMSMFRDGRKYYDNHTITVIGYIQYRDEHSHTKTMLLVHDNWFSSYSFLDYSLIHLFSEICY